MNMRSLDEEVARVHRRMFLSGLGRAAGGLAAAQILGSGIFGCRKDDKCDKEGTMGFDENSLTLTPNPTKGENIVKLEWDITILGSGDSRGGALYIDSRFCGNFLPKDGSFNSPREVLVATLDINKLGLEIGKRHYLALVPKTEEGCVEDFGPYSTEYLYPTTKNMLATTDWSLFNRAFIDGGGPGGFVNFSWDGAGVNAEYDFKGGPTTFNLRAATWGEGQGVLDLYVYLDYYNSYQWHVPVDPLDEAGRRKHPVEGWHDYSIQADIPAGKRMINIVYSNDGWSRDVHLDRLEIIEP